jgi:hypothetical protein
LSKRKDRELEIERKRQQLHEQASRKRYFLEDDPIKQYVRRFGWLAIIQDYARRRQEDGVNRPLRYLTLPGPAATDVGFFWRERLLEKAGDAWPHLVICDEEHASEALKVLGKVHGVSSKPYFEAVKGDLAPYFPFDVINLDMCNPVITGAFDRRRALRILRAIRQTIYLQRGQGFLLLLTCATTDRSATKYLRQRLDSNFQDDRFRESYIDRYGVRDPSPFENDYRAFVGLVLPKVIGMYARDRGYKVTEHFAAKYDRQHSQILSQSFELVLRATVIDQPMAG